MPEQRRHRGLRDLVRIGDRAVRERLEDPAGIRDAAGRGTSANVVSPPCCSPRRRTSASVSPGRRSISFMYSSASRLTRRPARANETRPRGASGRRSGSSSGRVSRTSRPPIATLSIEPLIGSTSSPNSVTWRPTVEVRRREHVRADAQREVAPLPRPDPAADAIGRLQQHRVQIAQLAGRGEPGDAAADDDDVVVFGHPATLTTLGCQIGRLLTDGSRADPNERRSVASWR